MTGSLAQIIVVALHCENRMVLPRGTTPHPRRPLTCMSASGAAELVMTFRSARIAGRSVRPDGAEAAV